MRSCESQAFGLLQTGRKRDCAPAAARAERAKRSEDGTPEGVPHTSKPTIMLKLSPEQPS